MEEFYKSSTGFIRTTYEESYTYHILSSFMIENFILLTFIEKKKNKSYFWNYYKFIGSSKLLKFSKHFEIWII